MLAKRLTMALAIGGFALLPAAETALAGAVITNGLTSLGVNDQGHLNFRGAGPGGTLTYGVYRHPIGDAISPGCLCEGWGVATTTAGAARVAGWASVDNGGIRGLAPSGTFGSTANTATSIVALQDAAIEVRHRFGPSLVPDIFQVEVTLTNRSASETYSDIVYRRAMDWDVPPTTFSERVTHIGVEANLESNGGNVRYASDNGFATSDPRVSAGLIRTGTVNTDFTDDGPADHGSAFDFAFGALAPGERRSFNIFYGSTPDEPSALSRLGTLNADVISLGQQRNATTPDGQPATFVFAFGGVGGVAPGTTPENPVLPFVPAPGQFVFFNPEPRRWFDPPLFGTFEYELVGDGRFLEVAPPPEAFGFGDVELFIPGLGIVAILSPGEVFDFLEAGLLDITLFRLTGISPLLDLEDPDLATAFPTFLDFSGDIDELLMRAIVDGTVAVSEPGTLLIFAAGLGLCLVLVRRRSSLTGPTAA